MVEITIVIHHFCVTFLMLLDWG